MCRKIQIDFNSNEDARIQVSPAKSGQTLCTNFLIKFFLFIASNVTFYAARFANQRTESVYLPSFSEANMRVYTRVPMCSFARVQLSHK